MNLLLKPLSSVCALFNITFGLCIDLHWRNISLPVAYCICMFTLANRRLPLLDTVCKALLLSLSASRPVGWESRERRRSCWMKTTTCGWLWDTNTLLRCQREWLWLSNHTWMDKQPQGQLLLSQTGSVTELSQSITPGVNQLAVNLLSFHSSTHFTWPSCLVSVSFVTGLWLVLWKNSPPAKRWTLEKR